MLHLHRYGIILVAFVAACGVPAAPAPAPTPTCYPRPEPTGERVIEPIVMAAPAPQVRAGQSISLTFTGGYLVGQYAVVCGTEIVEHRFADEMPGHSWDRTVDVRLDDRVLASTPCGYTCTLAVAIPADTVPGLHRLEVGGYWPALGFDLDVGTGIAP